MNKAFRRQAPAFPSTKCALVMVAVLLLPGCARQGDFGRPETYTFLGHPLDAAYWTSGLKKGSKSTKFGQTPAETEMRETAYRLRVQIGSLKPMKLSLSPETAYAERLTYEQHTYGPSRAALMEQELEADHQALSRFADAARRVLAADRQRMFALLSSQDYLSKADNRSARNRMRKNYAFIEGTFVDLDKRIAAYDHAIDRTRIETPGVSLASVEGSLNHLRDRAASLHYELSQSYEVAENYAQRRGRGEIPSEFGKRDRHARAPLDIQPGREGWSSFK